MKSGPVLSSVVLLVCLLGSMCEKHSRPPNIDFEGDASWYHGSEEEKQYLLKTFPADGRKTIPWPPEELARYVDISIDVTQSSFTDRINYRGTRMPWAEYNVRKFADYLRKNHGLLPGDRITLRVFGTEPENQKKKIAQDQSVDIINPPLQVDVQAATYTARYNDRHLVVDVATKNYADFERNTIDQIEDWSLDQIRKDVYTKSPLLDHIANVKRLTDSKTVKRLLIFVTDGHIDFDDVYFSPDDYSQQTVDKIKNDAEQLKLKPFTTPDPNVSVIVFGLNDRGDERFRQRQESLLRWFFDQQPALLIKN